MPRNPEIKKTLVIGSGPIIIGQAAEFDYSGTQACLALKEDGIEAVLINSNPATIMTDNHIADKIYIEPITVEVVERIIALERPDSVLPTLGGQTGLNIAMELHEAGVFEKYNVKLLGANPETIKKAEDRGAFKETMQSIDQPLIPSTVVTDTESAVAFANEVDYPVVVRPAYTLGGSGGGIVYSEAELRETCDTALKLSRVGQTLIEKCISGWKEIEFEVMRDSLDNKIIVCGMENIDPVGVHTGDSVVVAPCQTLADKEFQMLRTASLNIVSALGIEGGCNVQLALHPDSYEYAVIEVNPRVSRSSALASKATGYPIAKVAAKIAIGYTLDEIQNAVTKKTVACFEPALDYCVVKFPRFPFDKFVYAKKTLGTQMQATGEIMAIGTSFEAALLKAVRSIEKKTDTMNLPIYSGLGRAALLAQIAECDDDRLFLIYQAFKRGVTVDEIFELTKIDRFFLYKLLNLLDMENRLSEGGLDDAVVKKALDLGYTYSAIERISGEKVENKRPAVYKTVDTCAAEFEAFTPYYYSSYDEETEAVKSDKKKVLVIGSGPIRIGQGIEFDYCTVHSVWALKEAGYEAIIANNNPETVSTDFDTSDRLYFDPLTPDDIDNVLAAENPDGVIVQFGGQTAIKLAKHLHEKGVKILGTSFDMIDAAEDRELFDAMLERCQIPRPLGSSVFTTAQAVTAAEKIGFPVLLRPSYVLGGQNMIIAYNSEEVIQYMEIITRTGIENPVLVDKYIMGKEIEVDAICDGDDILIPGIMEHIERAGVHSGDSISVYPSQNVCDHHKEVIIDYTKRLAKELKAVGMINIQYVLMGDTVYVIEVNPRSSRTVPYISKVTGIPAVKLATRCMLGEKLKNLGYGTGLYPHNGYIAVKVPVFSFEKLHNIDVHLGPEMKSTGEVLGIARSFEDAMQKGLTAAGFKMKHQGKILLTVRDRDKDEMLPIAKRFAAMGFELYATGGTRTFLGENGLDSHYVGKLYQGGTILELIESGIDYVVSTSSGNRAPEADSVKIRRKAIECRVPCLTSIDTAKALCDSLENYRDTHELVMVNIANLNLKNKTDRSDCRSRLPMPSVIKGGKKIKFTKMHGIGNDYIYFNCLEDAIDNPNQLALTLSDRHFGVGGDGIVLIMPSEIADFRMRMFNSDGSEGKMCGNATRCVGKYVYDRGFTDKTNITLETLSGIKVLNLQLVDGLVDTVTVDMGKAELVCEKIPVISDTEKLIGGNLNVAGRDWNITCVSMGNPHCVTFCEGIADMNLTEIGPKFEKSPKFPDRINTEFVEVIDDHTLDMRVWERGTGETMACGTGACATVVAAVENGYCPRNEEITVQLLGGNLYIKYMTDGTVFMTGSAEFVFDGELL